MFFKDKLHLFFAVESRETELAVGIKYKVI